MPSPVVPRLGLFFQLLPSALSISVIVIAIHVSLAKMFAKKFKYPVDTNQAPPPPYLFYCHFLGILRTWSVFCPFRLLPRLPPVDESLPNNCQ